MKTKYIFLDIDGVLCTDEVGLNEKDSIYPYPFNSECVKVLNKILLATDAEIILSSDWRVHFSCDLKVLNKLFKHNKVIKSPVDITPDFNRQRAKEISTYLHDHSYINRFLILDDMNLGCYSLRFLQTNMKEGLLQTGVLEKAIYILNELDHSKINTCINCENEFMIDNDNYYCSVRCRNNIEEQNKKDKLDIPDKMHIQFGASRTS